MTFSRHTSASRAHRCRMNVPPLTSLGNEHGSCTDPASFQYSAVIVMKDEDEFLAAANLELVTSSRLVVMSDRTSDMHDYSD